MGQDVHRYIGNMFSAFRRKHDVSSNCTALHELVDPFDNESTWMTFIFTTWQTDAVIETSLWLSWAHCMVRAKWAGFALSVHWKSRISGSRLSYKDHNQTPLKQKKKDHNQTPVSTRTNKQHPTDYNWIKQRKSKRCVHRLHGSYGRNKIHIFIQAKLINSNITNYQA